MIKQARVLLSVAALAIAMPPLTQAAAAGATVSSVAAADDQARAKALLAKAVAHLKENGERAYAAFSRTGEFTDGEQYVYVVGSDGVLLASGGASFNFIGRNMLDYKDSDGKKLFQELLEGAKSKGSGILEYRWLNLQRGTVERKVAFYQAVGERIVAVGYYMPRGTPEQAKSILWRAADEVKRLGPQIFPRFNDINGGFVQDDTYVFVVGIKDMRMHAHGAMPRLVGRNVAELADANGKPIIRQMIDIVTSKGEGSLDYQWRNPVTGKIENKRTFLLRVGDYMIGVGYYQP
jgi:cytochrome c